MVQPVKKLLKPPICRILSTTSSHFSERMRCCCIFASKEGPDADNLASWLCSCHSFARLLVWFNLVFHLYLYTRVIEFQCKINEHLHIELLVRGLFQYSFRNFNWIGGGDGRGCWIGFKCRHRGRRSFLKRSGEWLVNIRRKRCETSYLSRQVSDRLLQQIEKRNTEILSTISSFFPIVI